MTGADSSLNRIVVSLGSKMIDPPVLKRAQRILKLTSIE